jgi:hypothetical protein
VSTLLALETTTSNATGWPLEGLLLDQMARQPELERLVVLIDKHPSDDETRVVAALRVAARNPQHWDWALHLLHRIDKPYRAACATYAAEDFAGPGRTELAKQALHWARVLPENDTHLCLAAWVETVEGQRREILVEAVDTATGHVNSTHLIFVIASFALLLLNEERHAFVSQCLKRATREYRERYLAVVEGLRLPLRMQAAPDEIADLVGAIERCGRWWP